MKKLLRFAVFLICLTPFTAYADIYNPVSATAIGALLIEDAINDSVTTKAPSENAVFDALALKLDSSAVYTDEMAQDAIGAMVNTSLTYTDATPLLALTSRNIGGVAYNGTADITPQQIQPAAENSDTTNFPLFANAASGTAQQPKYNSGFGYNASTNALTATTFSGALSGNATTATALAANGSNCSAGNYPLGVDASGSVESCTAANLGTVTSVTFTGDGTVLSSTPSSAVTTTGTVAAMLANAGAKTILGNPTSSSAAPVYTPDPVVSGTVTANIFNATATGTTPPYQQNGVQVFWQDSANSNIAVGNNTLRNGTLGSSANNSAFGVGVLNAVTTGFTNMGVGANALHVLTTGNNNTAVGGVSLNALTTGSFNVGIGGLAGATITNGNYNVVIGYESGGLLTAGSASNNVIIGEQTFQFFSGVTNTTAIGAEVGGGFGGFGQSISNCVLIGYDNTTQPNTSSGCLNIANAIEGTGLGGTPKIGIATASPSARLQLPAGAAGAGLSPFKLTSGTNLTSVENGAVEYDGTDYFVTAQSARQKVIKGLSGSFSAVGAATTTFTVTFGGTQPNSTYRVLVTPTDTLAAALFYVNNKTATTFDVVYLAGLTGTATFDWELIQ